MIRSELVAKLSEDNPHLTGKEIDRVVAAVFDAISDQLSRGGRVELRGFGTFTTRSREARTGRNPRTGEVMEIKESVQPKFKAGKGLKDACNA